MVAAMMTCAFVLTVVLTPGAAQSALRGNMRHASKLTATSAPSAYNIDKSEMCVPDTCQLPPQNGSPQGRKKVCKRIAQAKGGACGHVEGHRRRRRSTNIKDCHLINMLDESEEFAVTMFVGDDWQTSSTSFGQIILDDTSIPTLPDIVPSDLADCGGRGTSSSLCKAKGNKRSGSFQLHNKCRYVPSHAAMNLELPGFGCYALWKVPYSMSGSCPVTLEGQSVAVTVKEWSGCNDTSQVWGHNTFCYLPEPTSSSSTYTPGFNQLETCGGAGVDMAKCRGWATNPSFPHLKPCKHISHVKDATDYAAGCWAIEKAECSGAQQVKVRQSWSGNSYAWQCVQDVALANPVDTNIQVDCGGTGTVWSSCKAKGNRGSINFQGHNKCVYISSSHAGQFGQPTYGCFEAQTDLATCGAACTDLLTTGCYITTSFKGWMGSSWSEHITRICLPAGLTYSSSVGAHGPCPTMPNGYDPSERADDGIVVSTKSAGATYHTFNVSRKSIEWKVVVDCPMRSAVSFEYFVGFDYGCQAREGSFHIDPSNTACQQSSAVPYGSTTEIRYDRGQLIPANHADTDVVAVIHSHSMYNIVPLEASSQRHGLWRSTENLIECWRDGTKLHISGGAIYNQAFSEYDKFLDSHSVRVPQYFYKIITPKGSSSGVKFIAFLLPNWGMETEFIVDGVSYNNDLVQNMVSLQDIIDKGALHGQIISFAHTNGKSLNVEDLYYKPNVGSTAELWEATAFDFFEETTFEAKWAACTGIRA